MAVLDHDLLPLLVFQVASCPVNALRDNVVVVRVIVAGLRTIEKLRVKPDVFLVDAQELAHPYGCRVASHLGISSKKLQLVLLRAS